MLSFSSLLYLLSCYSVAAAVVPKYNTTITTDKRKQIIRSTTLPTSHVSRRPQHLFLSPLVNAPSFPSDCLPFPPKHPFFNSLFTCSHRAHSSHADFLPWHPTCVSRPFHFSLSKFWALALVPNKILVPLHRSLLRDYFYYGFPRLSAT